MPRLKREPYNPLLKSYPDSEKVNAGSLGAETLFTRLIAQADDADHYYADPGMVLGKLYTRRMCAGQVTLKDVTGWIRELAANGLVILYEVDGKTYLEVLNRRKELRQDVKLDLRFPQRTDDNTLTDSGRIRAEFVTLTQPNPTQPNPYLARCASAISRLKPEADVSNLGESAGEAAESESQPLSVGPRPVPVVTGNDNPPTRKPAVPNAETLPPGFLRFWTAWPPHFRKQGRKKCVELWKKQKLEQVADEVTDALQRCKASPDWARGFIPFPLTWLNRTPWETDPAEMTSADDPVTPTNGEFVPRDMTPEEYAVYHAEDT